MSLQSLDLHTILGRTNTLRQALGPHHSGASHIGFWPREGVLRTLQKKMNCVNNYVSFNCDRADRIAASKMLPLQPWSLQLSCCPYCAREPAAVTARCYLGRAVALVPISSIFVGATAQTATVAPGETILPRKIPAFDARTNAPQ